MALTGQPAGSDQPEPGSRTPPPLAVYHSRSYAVRAQMLGLLGMLPIISFPMWWAALVDERGYDLVSFGLLNTAQMIGGLITAIVLIFTIKRMNRSLVAAIMMVVMAVTYVSVMMIRDIQLLIILFGIKGAASGAAIAIATLYLGYTDNPDRQYAIGVTLATLAQSVIVFALPHLYLWVGNDGIQLFNATILIINAVVALSLPACMPDVEQQRAHVEGPTSQAASVTPARLWLAAIPIFVATICFNAYNYHVFNYSERVGAERGLDLTTIGNVLSITMLCGALGSVLAIWMGKRFGRVLPVVGGSVLGAASTFLLLQHGSGIWGYAVGLALFSIVWSLIQPYISAQTMAIDYTGRVVVASGPIVMFGGIGAAGSVTALSAVYGINGVLYFALAALMVCPIAMWASVRLSRYDRVLAEFSDRPATPA